MKTINLKYSSKSKLLLSVAMVNKIYKNINIPEDKNNCWIWTGVHDNIGYSKFGFLRGATLAHRIVYELIIGRISDNLVLDHLCLNKGCVNPYHLEQVTIAENKRRGNTKLQHEGYCKNGHKWSVDNIYIRPDGKGTYCRKCTGRYHPTRVDGKQGTNQNTFKTHCKNGHEFTKENTYSPPSRPNMRTCRICKKISDRNR